MELAIMFPMLEMADERHTIIKDVLSLYNKENPISDFREHRNEQVRIDTYIRKLTPN
jgi:hypothetical protein